MRHAGIAARVREWIRGRASRPGRATTDPVADGVSARPWETYQGDGADPSFTFSAHTRTVLTRLPGRPTDAGGIELPPLPPLTEDDLAPGRTRPWRLSDELPELDGVRVSGSADSPAPEPSLVRELLDRRAARSAESLAAARLQVANRTPVVESWLDPERRGWLILAIVVGVALCAIIVDGALRGLDRPVLPAYSEATTTTLGRPMVPTGTPVALGGGQSREAVVATQAVAGFPWRNGLPIVLGAVWLLGAWVIDHEARRALVVRRTWRDRPPIAYGIVAALVVTPIIIGGVLQAAWGTVSVLVQLGRTGGSEAGWRGAAVLGGTVVAVLVLRHPTLAGVQRLARGALGALREAAFNRRAPRRPVRGAGPSRRSRWPTGTYQGDRATAAFR